jgi:hypothetical protein
MLIRIGQNDTDPSGSRSEILFTNSRVLCAFLISYLRTCGSPPTPQDCVRKSKIHKVLNLRKTRKLIKPENLRISDLRNLFADCPPFRQSDKLSGTECGVRRKRLESLIPCSRSGTGSPTPCTSSQTSSTPISGTGTVAQQKCRSCALLWPSYK